MMLVTRFLLIGLVSRLQPSPMITILLRARDLPYKLDDLQTKVPSQPASVTGRSSSFDFGEEGDKLVEIVCDPLQFKATREAGNTGSDVYWGKDFLLVNVDDSGSASQH